MGSLWRKLSGRLSWRAAALALSPFCKEGACCPTLRLLIILRHKVMHICTYFLLLTAGVWEDARHAYLRDVLVRRVGHAMPL